MKFKDVVQPCTYRHTAPLKRALGLSIPEQTHGFWEKHHRSVERKCLRRKAGIQEGLLPRTCDAYFSQCIY